MKQENIKLLYIDLFCGAGGTSTGVESAKVNGEKCAKVIICVNHDANAIASHAANHPEALHYTEDIRTLNLDKLITHLENKKRKHPEAHVVLWASLECTNFSKAKGGMPRDADSRTLAEHLFRYIEALQPDYIQIENVEEFMSWGDLDEKGKPISRTNGKQYHKWVFNVKKHGYKYDFRILNSADFGAYTSRKRFFGVFAKIGSPIVFPNPTHSKDGHSGLFGSLKKWNAVKHCLDFNQEGESIFNRKKPLVEATLARLMAGLIKFVAGGKDKYLIQYNQRNDRVKSIEDPCNTVTTCNRFGLVQLKFISKYFSGHPESKNYSIEEPAHTITPKDHNSLIDVSFLSSYYGNGSNSSLKTPSPTVTTKDRLSLIRPIYFLDMQYGNGTPMDINDPAATVTTKHQMVECKSYLIEASQISDYIPPFTKKYQDAIVYEIYEDDSPKMKEIKEFMALYGIIDIKMRMLNIPELKMIMGFPEDYKLIGTQADQKKFIGNAVEVTVARKMCEALADKLLEIKQQTA